VEPFDAFTEDNDPHGERDFGAFEIKCERILWTKDYYDRSLTNDGEHPADPRQTVRVLAIMLASEQKRAARIGLCSPRFFGLRLTRWVVFAGSMLFPTNDRRGLENSPRSRPRMCLALP